MNSETSLINYPRHWRKPPFIKSSKLRWAIIIGALIYLFAAFGSMEIDVERFIKGIPRGKRFFDSFFPPNFADHRGVVCENWEYIPSVFFVPGSLIGD